MSQTRCRQARTPIRRCRRDVDNEMLSEVGRGGAFRHNRQANTLRHNIRSSRVIAVTYKQMSRSPRRWSRIYEIEPNVVNARAGNMARMASQPSNRRPWMANRSRAHQRNVRHAVVHVNRMARRHYVATASARRLSLLRCVSNVVARVMLGMSCRAKWICASNRTNICAV